jgi:hypothetical protein
MASPIVEVDTYGATVVTPDDGDLASAASINTYMQTVSDRTNFLKNRSVAAGGVPGASRIYVTPIQSGGSAIDAEYNMTNNGIVQIALSGVFVYFAVPHLPGAKFSGIGFSCKGGSGHGGSLPGTLPKLQLYKNDGTAGTSVVSLDDDSVDGTAYELAHEVTGTFTQETMTDSDSYMFRWQGESGANSFVSLNLYRTFLILDDQT